MWLLRFMCDMWDCVFVTCEIVVSVMCEIFVLVLDEIVSCVTGGIFGFVTTCSDIVVCLTDEISWLGTCSKCQLIYVINEKYEQNFRNKDIFTHTFIKHSHVYTCTCIFIDLCSCTVVWVYS